MQRRTPIDFNGAVAAGAVALFAAVAVPGAVASAAPSPTTPPVPRPPTPYLAPPAGATAAPAATAAPSGDALVGTFKITAADCSATARGSYFRMIQPGGNASGPFVQNTDSTCRDNTYTPLSPGTDGGLTTGAYQAEPDPAFDSAGNGVANRITTPQKFFSVNFATATNATDPQTGTKVAAPQIRRDASGHLSGDLRAFAASWNNQHFNQGSPKPDGTTPGTTAGPTGTIDGSGRFVLDWTSLIVGGPFNNFTGKWHLEGTFVASSSSAGYGSSAQPSAGGLSFTASPGASTDATGASTGPLPHTGPAFSTVFGVGLVLAGCVGLMATRRVARE